MNKQKKLPALSGVTLALAAAGLIAGCGNNNSDNASTTAGSVADNTAETVTEAVTEAALATVDLAHCYGVNACKGHNDCGTADNDCGGKASCKGTGFVATTVKSCGDIGGEVKDEWRGEVTKADLVHCNGVNICGGHNDCGTAGNDCAGKASCKGTGFVAMPAKACGDVGGEVG